MYVKVRGLNSVEKTRKIEYPHQYEMDELMEGYVGRVHYDPIFDTSENNLATRSLQNLFPTIINNDRCRAINIRYGTDHMLYVLLRVFQPFQYTRWYKMKDNGMGWIITG